jgi:antitoxin component YwqK of YwqJK toxin-antitoxin module
MRILTFIIIITLTGNILAQDSINRYDKAGKRHGLWIKKYPNGNIRYKGQFIHGKETGVFRFYSPDNPKHPIAEKEHSQSEDLIYVTFYQKNGKKESEGKMKGKKRTGKWTYYFADGKTILSTEEYQEGKLNGIQKTYYRNGKIAKEVHYKNGKKH